MKLLLAVLADLMIGLLLGRGIPLAVKGEPRLLIAGFLTYGVALAELGCLPTESY